VGNATIAALAQLAANFKNKLQKPSVPKLIQAPLNAAENKQSAALANKSLTYPMHHKYQTRPQQPIRVIPARNMPLL
jgi:hypothetical protein